MADEYESISDYIGRILKYHVKLYQAGFRYEEPERQHLLQLHRMVEEYLQMIAEAYRREPREAIQIASERGRNIANSVRELRDEILGRMDQNEISPRVGITYNRQLVAYRRIRDHAVNVAEAIAGLK